MKSAASLALLIPAYNAANHLPRLLTSARAQTQAFDEIWVYDDCSIDDTAEVAERYGARVYRGDVNRGCSSGKNRLAKVTTADWIHFHDADDDLVPGFVALARRWIENGESDVVLFGYEEIDDETGAHLAYRRFDHNDVSIDARSYAIRRQINPFCGLYRREKFLSTGGYDEDPLVLYNEDVAFHLRLAFSGLSFAAESEIAIINRRRMNSMSSANRTKCLQAQYHVMRKTAAHEGASCYAKLISARLWSIAGCLAGELDWKTADSAAKLAVDLADLDAVPDGDMFKLLCRLSPFFAIRARELLIRAFKPNLRAGYPRWRAVQRAR